jgi:hypothetical protein
MKILIALYYCHPYLSGLSVQAKRLARGLAARGHQVIIVTSPYDSTLTSEEQR